MERYCENYLKLEGNETDISRFVAKIQTENKGKLTYDFVIPRFLEFPQAFRNAPKSEEERQELISKYGYDNKDDWCIANWGTDDDCVEASYDESMHILTFVTWDSPPDKAIIAISKQFPTLKFTFEYKNFKAKEGPVADFGRFLCQNGKIESEEYGKIKAVFCPTCEQVTTYTKL